jgi:hypothetical protein
VGYRRLGLLASAADVTYFSAPQANVAHRPLYCQHSLQCGVRQRTQMTTSSVMTPLQMGQIISSMTRAS